MQKSVSKVFLGAVAGLMAFPTLGVADTQYVQCWAQGHSVRRKHQPNKDTATNSRFALTVDFDNVGGEVKEMIGHVEVANFVEGNPKIELADYYAIFKEKNKRTSLSPRATKYKDDAYFRLRDVSADETTTHDGGGMNGYLVISKKLLKKDDKAFDAHYVLQAGDHFGGSIDYTCKTN